MDITRTPGSVGISALSEVLNAGRGLVTFCRRKPLGGAGVVVLVCLVLIAILAPWISPYETDETFRRAVFAPPSKEFPLGGDRVGHDVMSRLFNGARVSLRVGAWSVGIGVTLGSLMGVVSGYFGGKFDLIFQRFVDAFIAFPGIILALALMAALGTSERNVIIALIVVLSPAAIRTVRSQALAVKEMEYVLAARAIGASHVRIILRHMVPNVMAIFIILCTLNLGYAIVVEASLSFLGVGVPPTTPTWGSMLTDGAGLNNIDHAPWLAIFPGLALALAVFSVNLLGDALRDVMDPRLRGAG